MITTFNTLAEAEAIARTQKALEENGFYTEVAETGVNALERIKALIPKGVSIHTGSSQTLEQIGFTDYFKTGAHGWKNLNANILAETDPAKQLQLRREAILSDYYIGSVHAVSETGELVIGSNTGSQLPHIVFTSPNIIFVVGTQKITPTLSDTIKRLEKYVVPLEDERIMGLRKIHTMLAKTVILHKENQQMGRTITIIFVKEKVGF